MDELHVSVALKCGQILVNNREEIRERPMRRCGPDTLALSNISKGLASYTRASVTMTVQTYPCAEGEDPVKGILGAEGEDCDFHA